MDKKIRKPVLGEAHTKDNIVTWIPSEHPLRRLGKILGQCKGNLADANVDAWSETTRRIKQPTKMQGIVVPGHGDAGTTELWTTPSGFWPGKQEY